MRFRACLLAGGILAAMGHPASAQDDFGLRDPSVGEVQATAYPDGFGQCRGQHLLRPNFISYPGPPDWIPHPWVEPPALAQFEAGAQQPFVDLTLQLEDLPPGTHRGLLSLKCVACSGGGGCAGETKHRLLSVEIPHPNTFGAHPSDAQFGGLDNGQPVAIQQLLPAVLEDISRSSFGQLPNAQTIISKLRDSYLENELSDVSLVRTEDEVNEAGRFSQQTIPVDDESLGPGEALYVRDPGKGPLAGAFTTEEIYLGVDLSTVGISEARESPADYYVFTVDGRLGVVKKADLVHNLIHEGLHAVQAGKYNVEGSDGNMGASLEEELDGFNAGNAAAAAMGLSLSTDRPGRGYGSGSNPNYPPVFASPAAGPGQTGETGTGEPRERGPGQSQEGAQQTPGQGEGRTDGTEDEGARPGERDEGPRTPEGDRLGAVPQGTDPSGEGIVASVPGSSGTGYCEGTTQGFECSGIPNYVLLCDKEEMPAIHCSPAGTGLADPCVYDGAWNCNEWPNYVVRCDQPECRYDAAGTFDACAWDGTFYVCDRLPTYDVQCSDGICTYPGTDIGQFPVDMLNSPIVASANRMSGIQVMVLVLSSVELPGTGAAQTGRRDPGQVDVGGRPAEGLEPTWEPIWRTSVGRSLANSDDLSSTPSLYWNAVRDGLIWDLETVSPHPRMYIRSRGASTGEAFHVEMANVRGGSVKLLGGALVVEPVILGKEALKKLQQELSGSGVGRIVFQNALGYCLEFGMQLPTAGTVFRVATRELQEQFAPVRRILEAGRKLQEAGLLNPDSDPTDYFHSIQQWAIWTHLQGFDLESFIEAFLEHTRENFEAAAEEWTDDVKTLVEGLIPNRWRDVQRVLEKARNLSESNPG